MTKGAGPAVFRILLAARDPEASRRFYESLLDTPGRLVVPGRYYFDCGPVILGVLDHSARSESEWSAPPESVYFATSDLEGAHRRARELGALDPGVLHGTASEPLGEIGVRPWGERSFYVVDPAGNSLCFVDDGTRFTGSPEQIAELRRAMAERPPPT